MRNDKEQELQAQRKGIRERLVMAFERRRLEDSNLTQAELMRRTGASSATVNEWFKKPDIPVPDGVMIARIARALRINAHWLLTGEGAMEFRDGQPEGAGEAFRAGVKAVVGRLDQVLTEIREGLPDDELTRQAVARLEQARRAADGARATPGRRGSARRRAS